jgi:FMN phosphatase YigB (HAD superfamily)
MAHATPQADVVFLFDVDNTLLDNDAVTADLKSHILKAFGPARAQEYWDTFEECRQRLGYADYLGALQQYRLKHPRHPRLLGISLFLLDYPFATRLYPGSLDLLRSLTGRGPVAILSDGDVVFQPRKVERSGLWKAVDGRVLIYIHKEQMLDDVQQRYPARRYVMVDDKVWLLAAMKQIWGERLRTVFVRQGHYALDPRVAGTQPAPDMTVESIGELLPRIDSL